MPPWHHQRADAFSLRASGFDFDMPTDDAAHGRTSLLAFRSSRAQRTSQVKAMQQPIPRASMVLLAAQRLGAHDEMVELSEDVAAALDGRPSMDDMAAPPLSELDSTQGITEDEDGTAVVCLPMPGSIPLLDLGEELDDDNELDSIVCDPSRLRHTVVYDENGDRVEREPTAFVGKAITGSTTPLKTGLLFKQGFGFLGGGWKVRFVVLTSSSITLYKEEHGKKRGEIDLAECTTKSIEIMPRDSVFDGRQATMWRFAVRDAKGKRMLFAAYTEVEMKDWLRCLHLAITLRRSGPGRFTDFQMPNGSIIAMQGNGQLRSSGLLR
ncbi:TPA: hypothetical protein N0F65_011789 [Lagenidium giganteum]|uniref:PH domain-containing protein n=1 Tax=Lagenidium giganteum TaxID=4803 RepID=A0AAV2YRD8_9STRA|nr:TPA: hypothetical protein N0F65_011789 [Lagenidium giganteum]